MMGCRAFVFNSVTFAMFNTFVKYIYKAKIITTNFSNLSCHITFFTFANVH